LVPGQAKTGGDRYPESIVAVERAAGCPAASVLRGADRASGLPRSCRPPSAERAILQKHNGCEDWSVQVVSTLGKEIVPNMKMGQVARKELQLGRQIAVDLEPDADFN
jgi:hypothetical protein